MALFNKKNNNNNNNNEVMWYEEILKTYEDITKKAFNFYCTNLSGDLFIITTDNKIIYSCRKYEDKKENTQEINIDDILKVDLNVVSTNRTVAKYFTLVPTVETAQSIDYIELKIITLDKIYRCNIKKIAYNKVNQDNFDNLEILATYLQTRINK
jgi:hypothetical protein